MTIKQLIQYLENPCEVQAKDIPDLKNLCSQYPYFYQAKALYLKYLKDSDDLQFNPALKDTALLSPDRTVLYNLMQKQSMDKQTWQEYPGSDTRAEESAQELHDGTTQAGTPAGKAAPTAHVRAMETEYKLDESDISQDHKLKHQDLIDKFIAADPHIRPVGSVPLSSEDANAQAGTLDISYTDEDITDSVFSESLARIYIKQKQYSKAIRIFEKLNLKYPEKSTYFADQIRFLNKVINNS